jgi:hypothetical protein
VQEGEDTKDMVRGNGWGRRKVGEGIKKKQKPKPSRKEENVDQELKDRGAEIMKRLCASE